MPDEDFVRVGWAMLKDDERFGRMQGEGPQAEQFVRRKPVLGGIIFSDHTFVASDSANLFVRVIGSSTRQTPVVVQHGGPGWHSHVASEAAYSFLSSDRQVVVFDARGSGDSEAHPPLTHERWAGDIDEIRRWLGADSIILAGHSHGGYVALEYALRHQAHLAGLILEDTAASTKSFLPGLESLCANPKRASDSACLRRLLEGKTLDSADYLAANDAMARIIANDATASAPPPPGRLHFATHNAAFAENLPHYDLRKRLPEIRCPSFVAVGRRDLITPVSCSEELAQGLKRAEFVVFDQSGHSPAVDEPALFRKAVGDFLARTRL
jgi:proline iminopeptidase